MIWLRTPLLVTAAGCALLAAMPAQADTADDAPITTAALTSAVWATEGDSIAYQYPERAERLAPAFRCSGELTVGAQKGYLYRNHGLDVANGEMTSQAFGKATCGDVSLGVGGSVLLSDGRDGIPTGMQTATGTPSERLANEAWVTLSYHPTIDTPIGRFNLEGTVVYRVLNNGPGGIKISDDNTQLVARIGYPITYGTLTVEPYLRTTKENPLNNNNSLYWTAEGVKVDWQYARDLSLHLDLTYEHNVNSVTAVVHRNVWYGSASIRKEFLNYRWSMRAGVQFSQYANYDRNFDFAVERDGRLLKTRSPGRREGGFEVYPFVAFSRAF